MIIPFATQSYKSNSLPVSAQQCVNMYAEREPPDAKTSVAILGAPGITTFLSAGSGPIRGTHIMNSVLYVVSGNWLYSVDSTNTVRALGGPITESPNMVSMADNGTQVCIVTGVNGYIYASTGGFQQISSANFHPANTVTFFDNYFVFDWVGTNKYFISSILDGLTYTGLDFASAEVDSDFVLATINQQENLLIFGERTIETWYDAGATSFPFQRYDGATIQRGCAAALTPIKEDNSVFFLGDDLIFYRLNGIIPVRVSTHAIEYAWGQYTTVSDAYCFSYTTAGHKFVVLTFPTASATWVYDISTNLWHERVSWNSSNTSMGRWRATILISYLNRLIVGDIIDGSLGMLSNTTFTEYGNTMQGMLVAPPIHSDRKRIFHNVLELDMETGVGTAVSAGSDPQVMLDWSDDGGRTYSGLQLWRSLGKIGKYKTRLRWLRLGQSRQRTYRVTISDPVKRTLIAANAEFSIGM